jgi:hypothetical protein
MDSGGNGYGFDAPRALGRDDAGSKQDAGNANDSTKAGALPGDISRSVVSLGAERPAGRRSGLARLASASRAKPWNLEISELGRQQDV